MHRLFRSASSPEKARLHMIIILLIGSSVAVSSALLYRSLRGFWSSGNSLMWDLFLAWIPLTIAYLLRSRQWTRQWAYYSLLFLWLIFFPNSGYLLTQLTRHDSAWMFIGFFITFSIVGIFVGTISLLWIHIEVRHRFGPRLGDLFIACALILSGIGVYAGRYIRLNSWDILVTPLETTRMLVSSLVTPTHFKLVEIWGFIGVIIFLQSFIYGCMHLATRLIVQESKETSS